ncbi:MAG: hypothetical protein OXC09_09960 [Truepera sp.]|nr:hypothetical protein [Truepera sp.]
MSNENSSPSFDYDYRMEKVVKSLTSLKYHRWILSIVIPAIFLISLFFMDYVTNLQREVISFEEDRVGLLADVALLSTKVSFLEGKLSTVTDSVAAAASASVAADAALSDSIAAFSANSDALARALFDTIEVVDAVGEVALAVVESELEELRTLVLDHIAQEQTGP